MSDDTTASKVNRLLQKSRQAFRIYSSMSKSAKAEHNEFADMQATEWRNINAELIRQLTHIVEKYSAKNLVAQIARMRDILLADFRRVESELNNEHRDILSSAERGDFVQVAQQARVLISKKAFVQAAQAASHELSLILEEKPASARRETPAPQRNSQTYFPQTNVDHQPQSHQPQSVHEIDEDFAASISLIHKQEEIAEEEQVAVSRMAKVIPLRR